jgi:MFS family permease
MTTKLSEAPVPDAHKGMLLRVSIGMVFGTAGTRMAVYGSTAILLPLMIVQTVGEGQKQLWLGIVQLFGTLVGVIGAPIIGAWSDRTHSRWGRRLPWLLASAAIGAIGLVLSAFAFGGISLTIMWGIAQLGFSCSMLVVGTLLPEHVPENRRGTISAITAIFIVLATISSGFIAAPFAQNIVVGLIVLSAIMLIGSFICAAFIPKTDNRNETLKTKKEPLTTKRAKESLRLFFSSFRNRNFTYAFLAILLITTAYQMMASRLLYYLQDVFNLSIGVAATTTASLTAITGLLNVVAMIIAGPLSDKVGRRPFAFFAGALIAIALVGAGFSTSITQFTIFYALLFLAFGSFNGINQALAADVLPAKESVGKDLAIMNTAGSIAQSIGPLFGSFVLILCGNSYTIMLIVAAIIGLLEVVPMLLIKGVK